MFLITGRLVLVICQATTILGSLPAWLVKGDIGRWFYTHTVPGSRSHGASLMMSRSVDKIDNRVFSQPSYFASQIIRYSRMNLFVPPHPLPYLLCIVHVGQFMVTQSQSDPIQNDINRDSLDRPTFPLGSIMTSRSMSTCLLQHRMSYYRAV